MLIIHFTQELAEIAESFAEYANKEGYEINEGIELLLNAELHRVFHLSYAE